MLRFLIIWPVCILLFCAEDIRAQRDEVPVHQIAVQFQEMALYSGADQLKRSLFKADSLDALIPSLMLGLNLNQAHECILGLEKELLVLRNSMSYLHQNMAFQKKVSFLSDKGLKYRSQLFELAINGTNRDRTVHASPVLVPEYAIDRHPHDQELATRVEALQLDTARLSEELRVQIQMNDSLSEHNQELMQLFNRMQEPIVFGLSIGISIARNRFLRDYRAVQEERP